MSLEDTSPATEKEVEEIDMLQNLSVTKIILDRVKEETRADTTLEALTAVITEGWPNRRGDVPPALCPYHPFTDELVVLFKVERLIVLEEMRAEMIDGGIQATLRMARDVFYWQG